MSARDELHVGRGFEQPTCVDGLVPRVVGALETDVHQVLDPRPLLDDAAIVARHFGGTGLPIAETITTELSDGSALSFGSERNVGTRLAEVTEALQTRLHILE